MNPPGVRPLWQRWATAVIVMGAALAVGSAIGWWIFRPELSAQKRSAGALVISGPVTTRQPPVSIGQEPRVGEPPPDFTLKALDGGEVTLSSLRGQPVLINFWASWCPPCRLEMPDLVQVYEAHKAEGFVLLGVNLTFEDSLPDIRAFVKEFNMTFPVLLDEAGVVTDNLYRLRGLPMSVFVDRAGIVKRIYIGGMTGAQIDQFVAEILK